MMTTRSRRALPPAGRITAKNVAALAGVSTSAVSRAFTKGGIVSPETRERVLKAAKKLGYRPNIMARSLMTGRTELIGLVSSNFDNPAFMEIFDLFTRRLQQYGLRPLLANLSGGAKPRFALDMLQQYNVDAVIVASSTLPPEFIEGCIEARLPLVHAFGQAGRHAGVSVVAADNLQGGRLAGEMLLERGYNKIAFLGGPQTASSTADRLNGLQQALGERGLRVATEAFGQSYSHEAGQSQMQQILRYGGIDAVFCGDDILAMGALDACTMAGYRVPDDMAIIGFNDIAMASWPAYRLTTIRQPIGEIILAAVELAIRLVEHPEEPPVTRIYECKGVIRSSLRP